MMDYGARIALRKLARRKRRETLQYALKGTIENRLDYCLARAAEQQTIELLTCGIAGFDSRRAARLALHWFERLDRIARRRGRS